MPRVVKGLALVVVLGLVLQACTAGLSMQSSTPLTPLVVGWQQYFALTWQPEERGGVQHVTGYLANTWGFPAYHLQLLVDGLDASGQVVSQKVSWVGGQLPPGIRTYFDITAPQPAVSYRVSVFAYDWIQTASATQAP